MVKAVIRAGMWLDEGNGKNRMEAVKILSKPEYVGADVEVIANSMTGTFEYEKGDKRDLADFNVFYRYNATYPYYSDAIWYLTQMRRWGQIGEKKDDAFYFETAKKVYLPEVWKKAATELVKEGKMPASDIPKTDGFKPATSEFIDGITYDGKKPNSYLSSFKIGLK
jgi:nitrate/nitrite transport system substrate-binding protein